jgi:hypothetical protein
MAVHLETEVGPPKRVEACHEAVEPTSLRGHNYGTAVEFFGSPSEAAGKAAEDRKLLFLLHLSGNFEDPQFT